MEIQDMKVRIKSMKTINLALKNVQVVLLLEVSRCSEYS